MASTLILPEGVRPTNLHLNQETDKARFVSSDMYRIADRIGEISPNLYVLELERQTAEGASFAFAIMERCDDGVDRLIFRATRPGVESENHLALDGRVLQRLRYLMSIPLQQRLKECEDQRAKWETEQIEASLEELYESMGGPMYDELHRNGFTGTPKSMSVRPLNRTARRHGRR